MSLPIFFDTFFNKASTIFWPFYKNYYKFLQFPVFILSFIFSYGWQFYQAALRIFVIICYNGLPNPSSLFNCWTDCLKWSSSPSFIPFFWLLVVVDCWYCFCCCCCCCCQILPENHLNSYLFSPNLVYFIYIYIYLFIYIYISILYRYIYHIHISYSLPHYFTTCT